MVNFSSNSCKVGYQMSWNDMVQRQKNRDCICYYTKDHPDCMKYVTLTLPVSHSNHPQLKHLVGSILTIAPRTPFRPPSQSQKK